MKIFQKVKKPNGHRQIYFCGIKVFSYNKKLSEYERIFAKRFEELTDKEIRFCLEKQFKKRLGYSLNLDNPKTFNEKLQWLKLYYHHHPDPLLTQCADKVGVREYIKEKIGEEYLVPCLGIWDDPREIDFDKLPNRFVLKINWGSGQNIIVKDKSKLNISETIKQLSQWIKPKNNHYWHAFEWPYKNIKPKIIAEKYIEQMDGQLTDYKFMCFNGRVKWILVCHNRTSNNATYENHDMKWNLITPSPNSAKEAQIKCPKHYKEMLQISAKLSKLFPFVRVDFFAPKNKLFVGEMTFFPTAGYNTYYPEWDKKTGEWLHL